MCVCIYMYTYMCIYVNIYTYGANSWIKLKIENDRTLYQATSSRRDF